MSSLRHGAEQKVLAQPVSKTLFQLAEEVGDLSTTVARRVQYMLDRVNGNNSESAKQLTGSTPTELLHAAVSDLNDALKTVTCLDDWLGQQAMPDPPAAIQLGKSLRGR